MKTHTASETAYPDPREAIHEVRKQRARALAYTDCDTDANGNFLWHRFPKWAWQRMNIPGQIVTDRVVYARLVMKAARPDGSLQNVKASQRQLAKAFSMPQQTICDSLQRLQGRGLIRPVEGGWMVTLPRDDGKAFVRLPRWVEGWLPQFTRAGQALLLELVLRSMDGRRAPQPALVRASVRELTRATCIRMQTVREALAELQDKDAVRRSGAMRQRSTWHIQAPQAVYNLRLDMGRDRPAATAATGQRPQ